MDYFGDIIVVLETGKERQSERFENEKLSINKTTLTEQGIWIKNNNDGESEFFESLKLWHKLDKEQNRTTCYRIETSDRITLIDPKAKYVVRRINQENQSIVFDKVEE